MKRFVLSAAVCVCLLFMVSALYAEEPAVQWGSYYSPGNFIPEVSLSYEGYRYNGWHYYNGTSYYGWRLYGQLGLYPGAEIIMWNPDIEGFSPFALGLSGVARIGVPLSRYESFTVGAGAEAVFHLGFRGFDFPGSEYLDRVDLFVKLGVGFDFLNPDGFKVGFISQAGVNYFLNDRFNVGVSYRYWGANNYGRNGVAVQARYRFGKTSDVKGMGKLWDGLNTAVGDITALSYVSQFYTFYSIAAYTGGYYYSSSDVQEGTGGIWSYKSDGETFFIERTFLEAGSEGGQWWLLRYFTKDGEEVRYEYYLSPENELKTLYYRDENGKVQKYSFTDNNELIKIQESDLVTYEEMESAASRKENVRVNAGSFPNCLLIERSVNGEKSKFWYTDDESVPGGIVKFFYHDANGDKLNGELHQKLSGRKGQFELK